MNIDEIRARAEAATAGPWINRPDKSFNVQSSNKNIASCFRENNADFIAHAREDIPSLLDALEQLRAENISLRAERDALLKSTMKVSEKIETIQPRGLLE